jgi:hypothetical protein
MSVLIMAFPALPSVSLLELAAPKMEGANNIAMVDGITRVLAYE